MKVLMNTLSTASDRHAGLLADLEAAMHAVAEDTYPGSALGAMRTQALRARDDIVSLADGLARAKKVWEDRPRRGLTPELRLTLHAEVDARGAWRLSWMPVFASYDDVRAFQNVLTLEIGHGSTGISVMRFHEIAEHLRRVAATRDFGKREEMNACRRILLVIADLQNLAVARLAEVCPHHVQQIVEVGYNGELVQVDLDRKAHEDLSQWISEWEATGPVPLGELRHAVEAGLSISALHNHVRQHAPENNISLAEVSRAITQMRQVLDHNDAWWRSGPLVPVPSPAPLSRAIPANRSLVQMCGSRPRLSPIASRGTEASALVAPSDLRNAMAERIAAAPPRWHFTAGDFIDLVEAGDRKRILRCLDRMKRTSEITPVSKGVYRRTDGRIDPLSGLLALLRDRGEFACPSPEDRKAFFTDGRLRSFRYGDVSYRLRPEPRAGLCRAATEAEDMEAFVRLALHLSKPNARPTKEITRLGEDYPHERRRAEQLHQGLS